MNVLVIVCLISLIPSYSHAVDSIPLLAGHLTIHDKKQMRSYFESHITPATKDAAKIYHSLLGLSSLGIVQKNIELCESLSDSLKSPEAAFHRVSIGAFSGNTKCKVPTSDVKTLVSSKLNEGATAEDVYYLVSVMKSADMEVDKGKVTEIINKIKAKDSSALTMAYIFQTVVKLSLPKPSLKPYFDAISDVLEQADELNGNQLFYERGIFTTAMVAKGIAELIDAYGELADVSESKLAKLINYLYTRRHSTNLRAAAHVVASLKAFSANSVIAPVVIMLGADSPSDSKERFATGGEVHRDAPRVQLRLSNLWGNAVFGPSEVTVKAGGLYAIQGPNKIRVLSGPADRGSFSSPGGKSFFELSLKSSDGSFPSPNWYELDLFAQPGTGKSSRKLLGAQNVQVPLRVLTGVKVVDPALKIVDGAHGNVRELSLKFGTRTSGSGANGSIPVEIGQQLSLSLRLVDDSTGGIPLTAHQAFVQLTHQETGQSITFVCNEVAASGIPNAKAYQLKLDPENSADDFDNLGGIYKMELMAGDSLFLKPVLWHIADLNLRFIGPEGSDSARRAAEANDVSRQKLSSTAAMKRSGGINPLIGTGPTKAKPGIEHVFRPPERRAPRPLAWGFTVICAVPLLGLLISWVVIGVNVGNFRFSLSAIIFHLGFIAILVLYYIYWCYLDMFTTLGYLALLGIPTFLAGNSVLRTQLAARQAASGGHAGIKK